MKSLETDRSLAVQQRSAAAGGDGPVAEVEHVIDLLSQLGCVFMLRHKPYSALLAHALKKE